MADTSHKYKMSAEDQNKVEEWLRTKWPGGRCSMCGNTDWRAQESLGIIPLFKEGSTIAGAGFPVIVVICSNCGQLVFVSAMVAGVVQEPEEAHSDGE